MSLEPPPHRARWAEWLFGSIGVALLVWYGFITVQAALFQAAESSTLDRSKRGTKTVNGGSPATRSIRPQHQLIGRLEIPRIHLSVMVVDGDDENTLRKGAGHLSDTPLPWEFGNSAVAGHRDSFFRPLQHVRVKDRLRLVSPHGEFLYEVSRIVIVEPDDLSVLEPIGGSSLTLITCYPFSYIGNAPKRFIVQARHVPI